MSAEQICEIYRRRWTIESLFKRLKQNFPLKYFLGDSVNAIEIQIWVTMIAYLLLRVIQHKSRSKLAFSNLVTLTRLTISTYIDIVLLLNDPKRAWKRTSTLAAAYGGATEISTIRTPVFIIGGYFLNFKSNQPIYGLFQRLIN